MTSTDYIVVLVILCVLLPLLWLAARLAIRMFMVALVTVLSRAGAAWRGDIDDAP